MLTGEQLLSGVTEVVSDSIRIGIVGAGQNTLTRHIPGLQKIANVELYGVCNQHEESTQKVAKEHGISQTYSDWKDLIADDRIDAVVIGTWPNLHCEISCAALKAGKHVLTEARMARNLAEATQMLECSQAHSNLTAMVVPSPFGLVHGDYLKLILEHGFIGKLREVVVLGADNSFWDFSKYLHPRQDQQLSGLNVLTMGILHETVSRWIPATEQVFSQSHIFEPQRPVDSVPELADVTVPDSMQVVTQIAGGARGMYHISGVSLFGPGQQIHLYGSEGAIKVHFDSQYKLGEQVLTGRIGDDALQILEIPEKEQGHWRVEEDFIAAIREEKPVTLNRFETALQYMQFTEAVHQSSQQQKPITLSVS
ncbi:MAG: Gfo/Idh/MocA family oxidoreductase [Planctomycetaceae bacterium]|nr:Gfo/Idh/MocA family oxidoreductase [Planctomycetaceae bacterium]